MTNLNYFVQKGLLVYDYKKSNKPVSFHELFNYKFTVLKVFRRFNCPLTRRDALELSRHESILKELGITVIGIGFDTAGVKDFIEGGFWNANLYLDPDRNVYRSLGLQRKNWLLNSLKLIKKETNNGLLRRGIDGEQFGSSSQEGGTYLIGCDGYILFRNVSDYSTNYPNSYDIIELHRDWNSKPVVTPNLSRRSQAGN